MWHFLQKQLQIPKLKSIFCFFFFCIYFSTSLHCLYSCFLMSVTLPSVHILFHFRYLALTQNRWLFWYRKWPVTFELCLSNHYALLLPPMCSVFTWRFLFYWSVKMEILQFINDSFCGFKVEEMETSLVRLVTDAFPRSHSFNREHFLSKVQRIISQVGYYHLSSSLDSLTQTSPSSLELLVNLVTFLLTLFC